MIRNHGTRPDNTILQASAGRERAVVIGAGMAGLLAARVLADRYPEVVVLEQDEQPLAARAHHHHLLLAHGCVLLERLFPGLIWQLQGRGAVGFDYSEQANPMLDGLRVPGFRSGVQSVSCSRAFLEGEVRSRLAALPGVRLQSGARVACLVRDGRGRVRGVRVCAPSGQAQGAEQVVGADLVVDASGYGSRVCEWLQALGLPRPEETLIDPGMASVSRCYRIAPERFRALTDHRVVVGHSTSFPNFSRGGWACLIEDGQMVVTLNGVGRDDPPEDEQGFLAFARSLLEPFIYDLIQEAAPCSPLSCFRGGLNRRRHFERLPRWPEGFVVLGDAACMFNPVYAQGMTVAAMSAELLGQVLARPSPTPCRDFQRELAQLHLVPWSMALAEDGMWASQGSAASLRQRVTSWGMREVMRGLAATEEGTRLLLQVMHLQRSPRLLLSPGNLLQVVRGLRLTRESAVTAMEPAPPA